MLTLFPFKSYSNINPWSESLVKKLVLGELSAEHLIVMQCNKKEPSLG